MNTSNVPVKPAFGTAVQRWCQNHGFRGAHLSGAQGLPGLEDTALTFFKDPKQPAVDVPAEQIGASEGVKYPEADEARKTGRRGGREAPVQRWKAELFRPAWHRLRPGRRLALVPGTANEGPGE